MKKINIIKSNLGLSGLDSHILNLIDLYPRHIKVFSSQKSKIEQVVTRKWLSNIRIRAEIYDTLKIPKKLLNEICDCDLVYFPNAHRSENHILIKEIHKRGVPIINRCGNFIKNEQELSTFTLFNAVITPSVFLSDGLKASGVKKEKIHVLYNLVSKRFFNVSLEKINEFKMKIQSQNKKIILYPGRLSSEYHPRTYTRRKGLEESLEMSKPFLLSGDAVFLVGGIDTQQEGNAQAQKELTQYFKDNGIPNESLIFVPEDFCNYANFATVIASADIVLHLNTRAEPFGQVVTECLAAKVPIVITKYTGAKEISRYDLKEYQLDNTDMFLVDPKAIIKNQSFLKKIFFDDTLLQSVRVEGALTAKRFKKPNFKKKFEDIINSV